MDALYCKLKAMDPHFMCARAGRPTPGLECAPRELCESFLKRLSGSRLVFVGDSTSLQMWMAFLLLLSAHVPALRCPDLSRAYRGEWGSDGRLHCALAPGVQICFAKAGMVPGPGGGGAARRSSAAATLIELVRRRELPNRSVVLVNAGLHYEDRKEKLITEATAVGRDRKSVV